MADKKISALTASTTPLAGTEALPIVQGGSTVQVSVANLTAGRAVSAASLTASTDSVIIGTTGKGITTGSAIPLGFGVNNAVTAITIDTSSNVGIGTASPSSKLTVAASNVTVNAGYGIAFTGDQNRIMTPEDNAFGALIKWGSAGGCRFFADTAERMRIDAGTGNVGIGTTAPAATALLDVQSTTKGVRFPNMTTTQKNAITPSAGTVIFDTTLAKLCVYSGSAWQTVTSI